jgi:hypothetical protein
MNVPAKSYARFELTISKIFLYFGLFWLGTSALAQRGDPGLIVFNGKIFTSVVARPLPSVASVSWRPRPANLPISLFCLRIFSPCPPRS